MFLLNTGKVYTKKKKKKKAINQTKTPPPIKDSYKFPKNSVGKKTSGDQLRVESPKLPEAFPQTLSVQRFTQEPIPFLGFKNTTPERFYVHALQRLFRLLLSLPDT